MRVVWGTMIVTAALLAIPAEAALSFNSGTLGTGTIANTAWALTPSGGTSPYVFSYAPGAAIIPGFQVFNAPDLPVTLAAGATGALIGIHVGASHTAVTSFTTTIRLTDSTSAFIDKSVTILVTPVDFVGSAPSGLGVGDTANIQFSPVDGTPPYTFSISSGSLPPNLTLNAATGLISGPLTTAGPYPFTLKMQDSATPTPQTVSHPFTLTVSPLRVSNLTNRTLPNGAINTPYNFQFQVTGGTAPYTVAVASGFTLPAGLTLSSAGLLNGIPTGSVYSSYTQLSISDSAGNANTIRVSINILPTALAPLGLTSPTFNDVALGDNADLAIAATGGVPPYTFDVAPGSTLPAGSFFVNGFTLSATSTAEWGYLRSRIHTPGTYNFSLRVTDSAGSQATRPYTINASPLNFWSLNLPVTGQPTPVLGTPYSFYLIPLGGTPPYTVTTVNAPAGLGVDNTGILSGTPAEAGFQIPLTLTLADSGGNKFNANGSVTINSSSLTTLLCSGGNLGTAQLGDQYSSNITCTGSPQATPVFSVSLVAGSLPPGLTVLTGTDLDNGGNSNVAAQLAGAPNKSGDYAFTLKITDGLGNLGQRQFLLHVSGLAIVNTGIAAGTVGTAYTQTFDVRGGTAPYAFSTTGNLPTGLSIDPGTGKISGTPTTTASVTVAVQVSDSAGDHFSRNYTLDIYAAQITAPNVLPNAVYGQPFSYTFTALPAATYQWSTTSVLPTGLTLNAATGVLSGVPTSGNGTTLVVITASTASVSATQTVTLFVTSQSAQPILTGLPEAPLADFVVGSQARVVLGVSGGTPFYLVTLVSPSTLPPGMELVPEDQYTGTGSARFAIAGVPTAVGNYIFTLQYADSAGVTENRSVSINVTNLALATTTPEIGIVGTPYNSQLRGVGGSSSYTFALANLHNNVMPPGLTLSSTGLITGTPTSTGAYTVTIQLTSGAASRRIVITIEIYQTTALERVDFDLAPLQEDAAAGHNRSILITPSSGIGNLTWSVVSGLPPGMQLYQGASLPPNYPGGASPPQAVLAGSPSTPGTYNIGISVVDSVGNTGVRFATLFVSPLNIGPDNNPYSLSMVVPPAQVGVPYSFAISLLSGQAPFTVALDAGGFLPGGMTMSVPGLLSGTPTDPGNSTVYGIITDANGLSRRFTLGLNVYPAGSPIGLAGTQYPFLTSAVSGTPYSFNLNNLLDPNYGTAPFTWSAIPSSPLPPGLSIVPGSGANPPTLAGTAGAAGNYIFALQATDANGRVSLQYGAELYISPVSVSPASLPSGIIGVPYSQTLPASGGTAPYTYQLLYDSALPAGLTLSSGGVLSGTPASSTGPFVLGIFATDSANNTTLLRTYVTILPITPTPSGATFASSGAFTQTFAFTFSDPVSWQNLGVVDVLVNNFLNGIGACYFAFKATGPAGGNLYLVDDQGDAGGPFAGGLVLPTSASIQNSQCSISGAGSSVSGSGNTLTLTLAITFSAAFGGNKIVYMAAFDQASITSGWEALQTYGVPFSPPAGPAVGGVSPSRTAGSGAQTYVFTFNDTNGVSDLGVVNVLINNFLNGQYACYIAYARAANVLYLVNDPGTALLNGLVLNGSGTTGNSQCVVNGAGSSAVANGNTLTLTLNMSFPESFVGNRVIYMAARSNGDVLNSGWQSVGSRTVQ